MESIYGFCVIIGGVFVAIAILGGPSDIDADANIDVDADADIDADADVDADVGADFSNGLDGYGGSDLEIDTDVALDHVPTQHRATATSVFRRTNRFSLGILTSFKFWTVGSFFFGRNF